MAKVDYAALKKGGFMPQKQKDHFSLRVAVTGGHLTATQLAKVSEIAEKYGKDYVHLTSRQSVEIPFIPLDAIEAVKADLATVGLHPGVVGPGVRTVTSCQGNEICASGNINSYDIAKKIDARYEGRELPHKFKFGVTGCQNNCLKAEENDVGIKGALDQVWKEEACIKCGKCTKVCRESAIRLEDGVIKVDYDNCIHCGRCVKACPTDAWDTTTSFWVSFGGLFGNKIAKGETLVPLITSEEDLFKVTDTALDFFAEYGQPKERFKFTIERIGKEVLQKRLDEALNK